MDVEPLFQVPRLDCGAGALVVVYYLTTGWLSLTTRWRSLCGGCSNRPWDSISRTVRLLMVAIGRLDLCSNKMVLLSPRKGKTFLHHFAACSRATDFQG